MPATSAIRMVVGMGNNITEANFESLINELILNKTVGLVPSHKICTACVTDVNTWLKSDLITLLTFIKTKVDAKTLRMMNWGEYLTQTDDAARKEGRVLESRIGIGL